MHKSQFEPGYSITAAIGRGDLRPRRTRVSKCMRSTQGIFLKRLAVNGVVTSPRMPFALEYGRIVTVNARPREEGYCSGSRICAPML